MVDKSRQRSVRAMAEHFDAKVMVSMHAELPGEMKSVDRAVTRARVIADTGACRACPLGSGGHHVPPRYPGARPVTYAVIGTSPDWTDVRLGNPFMGRAGRVLKGALISAGGVIEPVAWINTISCPPPGTEKEGLARDANDAEIHSCRENVMAQLHAADTKYVLLVGTRALDEWRRDVSLRQVSGVWGVWDSRWIVMAVSHPNQIIKARIHGGVQGKDDALLWQGQIHEFVRGVEEQWGLEALGYRCTKVRCGLAVDMYDRDGIPWCARHYMEGAKGHDTTEKWWRRGDEQEGLGI